MERKPSTLFICDTLCEYWSDHDEFVLKRGTRKPPHHVVCVSTTPFKTLAPDARQIILSDAIGWAPVAERGRRLKNERKTREKRLIWVRLRNICPDGIVRQILSHLRQTLLKRPDEGSRTSYHYLCNSVGVLPDDR